MLAITTDHKIYILKYTYNDIMKQETTDEDAFLSSDEEFAQLIWNGTYWKNTQLNELGQAVYSPKLNHAYIISKADIQRINLVNLEEESQLLTNWQIPPQFEYAYENNGYLYIVAGQDGLYVYRLPETGTSLGLLKHLSPQDITESTKDDYIEDISVIADPENADLTYVYAIAKHAGICVLHLTFQESNLTFTNLHYSYIYGGHSGFSLDVSPDGKHIMALFKNQFHFSVVHYEGSPQNGYNSLVLRTSSHQMVDVFLHEEFAIIQGTEVQEILYFGIDPKYTYFKRGYSFLLSTTILPDVQSIQFPELSLLNIPTDKKYPKLEKLQMQQDKFIIGVTKNEIFISRFRNETAHVSCNTLNEALIGETFEYSAIANSTVCNDSVMDDNQYCQLEQRFSVTYVERIIDESNIGLVIVIVIVILVVVLVLGLLQIIIFMPLKNKVVAFLYNWKKFANQEKTYRYQLDDLQQQALKSSQKHAGNSMLQNQERSNQPIKQGFNEAIGHPMESREQI